MRTETEVSGDDNGHAACAAFAPFMKYDVIGDFTVYVKPARHVE